MSPLTYEGVHEVVGANGIDPSTAAVSGHCSAAEIPAYIFVG